MIGGTVHKAMLKASASASAPATKSVSPKSRSSKKVNSLMKNASAALPLDMLEKIYGHIEYDTPITTTEALMMSVWKAKKTDISKSVPKKFIKGQTTTDANYEILKYDGNRYAAKFTVSDDPLFYGVDEFKFVYGFISDAGSMPWEDFRKSVFADIMFADAMCRYTYYTHTDVAMEIPWTNDPQTPLAREISDAIVQVYKSDEDDWIFDIVLKFKNYNYILVLTTSNDFSTMQVEMYKRNSAFARNYDPEEILFLLSIDYDIITDRSHNNGPRPLNMMQINIIANHFAYKCGDLGVAPLPQLGPFKEDSLDIRKLIKDNNLLMLSK
jgi:hypothetical protein